MREQTRNRTPTGVIIMATVRARYEKGVLTPLDPLDLEEGREVVVSVRDNHAQTVTPKTNVLEDMAALAERLIEKYPDDNPNRPTDGSINYKHYLYGHPKKEP